MLETINYHYLHNEKWFCTDLNATILEICQYQSVYKFNCPQVAILSQFHALLCSPIRRYIKARLRLESFQIERCSR